MTQEENSQNQNNQQDVYAQIINQANQTDQASQVGQSVQESQPDQVAQTAQASQVASSSEAVAENLNKSTAPVPPITPKVNQNQAGSFANTQQTPGAMQNGGVGSQGSNISGENNMSGQNGGAYQNGGQQSSQPVPPAQGFSNQQNQEMGFDGQQQANQNAQQQQGGQQSNQPQPNQQQPNKQEPNFQWGFFGMPGDGNDQQNEKNVAPLTPLARLGWFALGFVGGFFGMLGAWLMASSYPTKKRRQVINTAWLGFLCQAILVLLYMLMGGSFPFAPTASTSTQSSTSTSGAFG
jgi:hypothetical protein